MGRFVEARGCVPLAPEWRVDEAPVALGTALVFSQDTPHEGAPVGAGRRRSSSGRT